MFDTAAGNIHKAFLRASLQSPIDLTQSLQSIASNAVNAINNNQLIKKIYNTILSNPLGNSLINEIKKIQIGHGNESTSVPNILYQQYQGDKLANSRMRGKGLPNQDLNWSKKQIYYNDAINQSIKKLKQSNQIGGCLGCGGKCKKNCKHRHGSDEEGDGLFFSGVPISAQSGGRNKKSSGKLKLNLTSSKAMGQRGRGLTFY